MGPNGSFIENNSEKWRERSRNSSQGRRRRNSYDRSITLSLERGKGGKYRHTYARYAQQEMTASTAVKAQSSSKNPRPCSRNSRLPFPPSGPTPPISPQYSPMFPHPPLTSLHPSFPPFSPFPQLLPNLLPFSPVSPISPRPIDRSQNPKDPPMKASFGSISLHTTLPPPWHFMLDARPTQPKRERDRHVISKTHRAGRRRR